MNGLAQIVGCLLMYGIGKNSSLSLAPWRVLFLICGALTSVAGVVFYMFMPNGPKDAWFLDERQRHVLSLRMIKDREGGDKTNFSVTQVKEAMLDVKSWFVFAFGVLITMQSPVLTVCVPMSRSKAQSEFAGHIAMADKWSQFASLVIKNIGYNKFDTLLYTTPSGAVQIAMLWAGVAACVLFPKNRTYVGLALVIPPLIGCICLLKLSLDARWGMIVASWLVSPP